MSPLLTVIIPTCDRPKTLEHCLRTVTTQNLDSLEILVSDNASAPRTQELLSQANDPRLKVIRAPKRLGMSEHWEFALGHASGKWVTFLGDDDGLLPDALEYFKQLTETCNMRAISSKCCSFNWPINDGDEGRLCVRTGEGFEIRNARQNLHLSLQGNFPYSELPWIYTGGFAQRNLLESIKKKGGDFFLSITPDLYSSVAISSNIKQYGFSFYPMFMGGTSKFSNGLKTFNSTPSERESIPFFKENKISFHEKLGDGFVPSLIFLLYECYLQAKCVRNFDFDDVQLEKQILLAVKSCKKRNRDHISSYMKTVCEINSLDWGKLESDAKLAWFLNRVFKKIKKVTSLLHFISPEASEVKVHSLDLKNVFDACVKAGEIIRSK